MKNIEIYKPKNHIRIVTASSLFDGHDASINIMRRILQASGAEVIHLGHNRSANEVVNCAIQEDVQAIALTSYQGGHIEYFKYMIDLLKKSESGHIKIFGGGGGVILPDEIKEMESYGVTKIYSPDDGRKMTLQGMINDLLSKSDFPTGRNKNPDFEKLKKKDNKTIADLISTVENSPKISRNWIAEITKLAKSLATPVLGITGTGGAGKSTLIDELVRRYLLDCHNKTIAIISIDPTKKRSGGALLGDRIRMNSINNPRVYMRSLATRQTGKSISAYLSEAINILKCAGFDLILVETSGIGQSDSEIINHSDISLYVMTPEYGAASQLEKIDMLDFADIVAINKFDKRGSLDALKDVKKQIQRNSKQFETELDKMPVFGLTASRFNDTGVSRLYSALIQKIESKTSFKITTCLKIKETTDNPPVIPGSRIRYLSEIADSVSEYNKWVNEQSAIAQQLQSVEESISLLKENHLIEKNITEKFNKIKARLLSKLTPENLKTLSDWKEKTEKYHNDEFKYEVRGKEVSVKTYSETISKLKVPKISMPKFQGWGDILKWNLSENVPGEFPFAAGVFPFRRENEDPARMFAGEGNPERTNRRFHYLSKGLPFIRLSTAFDSVTLYGQDPDKKPDIYGKIGNAGVSVATLDDAKKLYSGFDLLNENTSVSMTINGPAPAMVGFFFNTAIDQQCELFIKKSGKADYYKKKIDKYFKSKNISRPEYNSKIPDGHNQLGLMLLGLTGDKILPPEIYGNIKSATLKKIRGTVQADILKEDQAQNTCLFSIDFSLRMMGDIQEYFIKNEVKNFYSVSVSGYHIAEAGANPITQLALTLSNGFTYVEYYLSRGMKIDDFVPNLSFFFSNGLDAEYSVIGRVARLIWAKAMRYRYKANVRSQMLKYHIQTSGRSLHAQEIDFNDIRTTLQALYAIYDNCNSLHTNAFDEAITTPTENSVRRALAIQMIINLELGLNKNQNSLQGSFIIEELTKLVEDAVISEFHRLNDRGGVLGAMETMYQRNKIQEESMHYEILKNTGKYQVVGVNTFLSSNGSPSVLPNEVIRSTEEEKSNQIKNLQNFHKLNREESVKQLRNLSLHTIRNKNTFEALLEATKYCSIGQITETLFEIGGQYRRSM